ncbi:MAG TPA: VCBS repeat-containing protein [Planctomycetota bacterium]|nr:VCBS repeat-containing protein [Planctomycetota bacterium]
MMVKSLSPSLALLTLLATCGASLVLTSSIVAAQTSVTLAPDVGVDPWRKLTVDRAYRAEGANVADFDRDGQLDLVCGAFWFKGPSFAARTRIHAGAAFPIGGYSDRFFAFVDDLDGDGWTDVLTIGLPGQSAFWYRNPGPSGTWTEHAVAAGIGLESPAYEDLDGDGVRELVCAQAGSLVRIVPDRSRPFAVWTTRALFRSTIFGPFTHGFGIGDVDGDGRKDLLTKDGWLQQPTSLAGDPDWKAHPYLFSPFGGAQMYCADLDGDGDADVVSSFHAHGWGLAWYEHVKRGSAIDFVPHIILPPTPPGPGTPRCSQLHALVVADFDGDGVPDIATGKTFWAHNGLDPGAFDPAEVWIFRTRRTAQGLRFDPQFVDGNSGVGRQLVAHDVDRDGKLDLVVGNKKGAAIHFNQR